MSTELHFIQYIEGPFAAVDDLFAKLRKDRRHAGIEIIQEAQIESRKFGNWSLAYSGPDTFIDEELGPLLQRQPSMLRQLTASKLLDTLSLMASRQPS